MRNEEIQFGDIRAPDSHLIVTEIWKWLVGGD